MTPQAAPRRDQERLARAIHDGRITVTRHGKFTDRCICNDIARDILRGLDGLLPKPKIENVIAEYVSDPLRQSAENQAIPYEAEAAHPTDHEPYWIDAPDDETGWHCTICGFTEYPGAGIHEDDVLEAEAAHREPDLTAIDRMEAMLASGKWPSGMGITTGERMLIEGNLAKQRELVALRRAAQPAPVVAPYRDGEIAAIAAVLASGPMGAWFTLIRDHAANGDRLASGFAGDFAAALYDAGLRAAPAATPKPKALAALDEYVDALINAMDWLGTGSSSKVAAQEEQDARDEYAAIRANLIEQVRALGSTGSENEMFASTNVRPEDV